MELIFCCYCNRDKPKSSIVFSRGRMVCKNCKSHRTDDQYQTDQFCERQSKVKAFSEKLTPFQKGLSETALAKKKVSVRRRIEQLLEDREDFL